MKRLGFYLAASLVALGVILAVSWTPAVGAETPGTLNYSGQLFELKHKRMAFVDMVDWETSTPIGLDKDNKAIGGPIIIDKLVIAGTRPTGDEQAKYKQYPLNKTGAFILRFVLQQVDPAVIKLIYMDEYNVTPDTAISDINSFLDDLTGQTPGKPALLKKYNRNPNRTRPKDAPGVTRPPVQFKGDFFKPENHKIDVGLNQMGGGGYKPPPPPPGP